MNPYRNTPTSWQAADLLDEACLAATNFPEYARRVALESCRVATDAFDFATAKAALALYRAIR